MQGDAGEKKPFVGYCGSFLNKLLSPKKNRFPALPVAASCCPPRRPHWRSSPQVHAPTLPATGTVPIPPTHIHPSPPHLPPPPIHTSPHPRRRPTAPIPPDGATRPAPALPDCPLSPRPHPKPPPPDAQPHRAAPPHALPRHTRRSIHSDSLPCPPSTSPFPARGLPVLTESDALREARCLP